MRHTRRPNAAGWQERGYIPALSKVDPKIYGIALVTNDGRIYTAGDVTSEVSIQSISKVFTMAKVMANSASLSSLRHSTQPETAFVLKRRSPISRMR